MPPLEEAPPTRATMDETKAYRVLLSVKVAYSDPPKMNFFPAIIVPNLIDVDMPAALVSPVTISKTNELHCIGERLRTSYAILSQFSDGAIVFEHPLLPGLHVLADHHGDDAWQRALAVVKLQSKRMPLLSVLAGRF
jgi:hypothetical protein